VLAGRVVAPAAARVTHVIAIPEGARDDARATGHIVCGHRCEVDFDKPQPNIHQVVVRDVYLRVSS